MVDIIRCKEQLYNMYILQPALQDRFSDFTRQARGDQKAYCLAQFGSVAEIQKFLLRPGEIQKYAAGHTSAPTAQPQTAVTTGSDRSFSQYTSQIGSHLSMLGWLLVLIIIGITLRKIIKYGLMSLYDAFNAKRMIYARVILPRGDSKDDREKEREVSKDMKEKIGRMSQVFSALHRLGDLSTMDILMRRLFNKPKMTFIMHYEEGLLSFIIGTYPEYNNILEAAIAAQYPDASIESLPAPNLFAKKYIKMMPLQPVKSPYYPIRIFKQLEDDPLNNIIDAIGKVNEEDTFSVVLVARPEKGSFNEGAQKLANALFKKDEALSNPQPLWKKILPRNFFRFFIYGPSQKLIERFSSAQQRGDPIVRMVKAEEDACNIMAEEAAKPAYEGGLMLITTSDQQERANQNIFGVFGGYSIYTDEYNNALTNPSFITDILERLFTIFWKISVSFLLPGFMYKKNVFTVGELSSLFHFPDGTFNRSPIIKWMDYKVLSGPDTLPVPENATAYVMSGTIAEAYKKGDLDVILREDTHPTVGYTDIGDGKTPRKIAGFKIYNDAILLGVNVYRNKYTPVYMKRKDRTRHQYIIGKSGTGKSVLISNMARQDIWAGDGVCVIDPHGDLVEEILQYIPKERAKDVIYFDAGNEERPMGLNLYEIHHPAEADRAVNDATEMFLKMFGPEIFGPRIQEYFKFGSLTLLEDVEDGATLLDVPRLFTDEAYRQYKVKKVTNPMTKNFREKTYSALGEREKQEIIPYFTAKFVSFSTNSLIRNIIGQTKSAFDFQDVMDNKKILLINLSKGKIGELNAQLLGMILVSKIYNGAMARARIDEKDRKDFYLYVDEFQNFVTDTFADILSEARKYKLSLIMAHQYISQLDSNAGNNIGEGKSKVKDAVFGNVGTMMSFKVGAPDAEFLEKEYAPVLGPQDIVGISNYKAYIKLNINNATSRVFSMNTIWSEDYKNPKMREVLKQYCEKKYGRKKEFVDEELAARLNMFDTPAPEEAATPLHDGIHTEMPGTGI